MSTRVRRRRCGLGIAGLVAMLLIAASADVTQAVAAPMPSWNLSSAPLPTNFAPGAGGSPIYEVRAFNSGAASTDGSPIKVSDTLPAGLTVSELELNLRSPTAHDFAPDVCQTTLAGEVETVTCTISEATPLATEPASLAPGEELLLRIHVSVPGAASGRLVNTAGVQGGGAASASIQSGNQVSEAAPDPGLSEFRSELVRDDGSSATQAGSHPYQYITTYAVNTEVDPRNGRIVPARGDVKDIEVKLPPGLVGNPTAATACPAILFNALREEHIGPGGNHFANACPPGAAVGFISIEQENGGSTGLTEPIYNLVPSRGMPAQLGFQVAGAPIYIETAVRTGSDYGITASLADISDVNRVTAARLTLWGTPGEEGHDPLRGRCLSETVNEGFRLSLGSCSAGLTPKPFFRLPTSCASPMDTSFELDVWSDPGVFVGKGAAGSTPTGCSSLDFSPNIGVRPQATTADSSTGLEVDLHLPQTEDPIGLGEADLRDATVALPVGVTINPSSAAGLQGCSPAQIGLTSSAGSRPINFSAGPPACPDASKVGSVEVVTPLLDHPLRGSVYVATQGTNPFGSLLAIYIAASDPVSGVVLKLPGDVALDPRTGQVVARFEENPQLPFEDLRVNFFEGPRAPLSTPTTCGAYVTQTNLTPWSAPGSGPAAASSTSFAITGGPDGQSCPDGGFDPKLSAGTASPAAGRYSPFTLRVSRDDGSQRLATIAAALPEGLLGKLAGIPYCPNAALAAVSEVEGTGAAQAGNPGCPAASQVGTVTVGAGTGVSPLYLNTGRAYLAGPYKGAPLSLAIVTPAVAGPFDLGSVLVRTALRIDPESTRITAVADPLPTILHGIPLNLRDIRVNLDRPNFTLNPTSCRSQRIAATITGSGGATADPSDPFLATDCAALGFKPGLRLSLAGSPKRNRYPALKAVVTYPKGGASANIARAAVTLPHSEFLEQGHIGTICTRVQFAAGAEPGEKCPAKSIYGKARAFSPLLDQPLEGPIYLRSSNHKLPDLVADLAGQINVVLDGRIDSVHGGIRNIFEAVPDAPVSKFVLELEGGKKGLLVNSTNICKGAHRATAQFRAHNGRTKSLRPAVVVECGQKKHRSPRSGIGRRHD